MVYRGGFCRIKETKYHSVLEKGKKEDPENARSGIRTSVTEVMEQLILETMSKHRENKKVVWSHQHRFTRGKSCLTEPTVFYEEMTGLVDERRATVVVNAVSCNIPIDKWSRYELDRW